MRKTWDSTREALLEMIAASGLSWDRLAEETGVPKPSLYRFFHHRGGMTTASTDTLLAYFGLAVVEKQHKAKGG